MSKASENEPAPRCLKMALWLAGQGFHVIPVHNPVGPKHDRKCSCGNPQCRSPAKHPRSRHGIKDATRSKAQIRKWFKDWPDANVGVATGKASGVIVLDIDPRHGGDESLAALEAKFGKLPSTWRFQTGGGGEHYYFKHPGVRVPNSAGKLGLGLDIRGDGGYVVACPSRHINGKRYKRHPKYNFRQLPRSEAPDWFLERVFGGRTNGHAGTVELAPYFALDGVPEGQRDESIYRYACSCSARGLHFSEAMELVRLAARRCDPPFDEQVALEKVERVYAQHASPCTWPRPLGEIAFHGLAGRIVKTIEPHTEADPAALLVQFLVTFGNVIGREDYFLVEADRHYLNLFVTLVGETAKSRKGTSWGHIRRLFEQVDPEWEQNRIKSGLSSGEGLIWDVRDGVDDDDPGASDKRLLITETEFASTLRILNREGNTLSPVIRNAWDRGHLATLTKKSPAVASNAHVSIIGHITVEEVRRYLTRTELGNGFANRFLWVCVRRSKLLPDGGQFHEEDLTALTSKLRHVICRAEQQGEIFRTPKATLFWREVYPDLSMDRPGIFGAVTARAEAQVIRLACLYALLDLDDRIVPKHLEAALEVWRYCADSARYIFGKVLADPVADRILGALRENPEGMTRNDISELFSRNRTKAEIDHALTLLEKSGQAIRNRETKRGRGRPTERWQYQSQ